MERGRRPPRRSPEVLIGRAGNSESIPPERGYRPSRRARILLELGARSCRRESHLELRMSTITPAVAKRRHDALRACAANPQGLRGNAYPSVMPVLEATGLVARRTGGRAGRAAYSFLTPAGRVVLAEIGMGDSEGA